ncbi:hypothetical protein CJ030_MR2G004738 [Morella rubra]|uniref:F-box domain-containing protein n=1 Tax=Morella rubra TaxID=262757 RepID=A0A6A1WEL2_9ROSI|nr:hypothetical protein CJ030_MR2G004738 [Morella rubra]
MAESVVEWGDLPEELVTRIARCLDAGIDVLRFRSVCTSWRSSIPPFRKISPSWPRFPSVLSSEEDDFLFIPGGAFFSQRTIYRLERVGENPNPSESSPSKGWMINVEESGHGKIRLLNPFSGLRIRFIPESFPKVINLLDFRIVEVTKAYKLQNSSIPSPSDVSKVALFPNSESIPVEESVIFALYHEGKLGYAKYGDEKWSLVDDHNFDYDDMMVYKGQFYVVDRWGTISWIDSSLNLIQFSPLLCGEGSQKHLVESCGELYVVDRYFNRKPRRRDQNPILHEHLPRLETVDFRVYKLDQEWAKWVRVNNLGDRVFILGNDCSFSVSAPEFAGCEGNQIYFADEKHMSVFNLKTCSIGKIPHFPDYSLFCHPNLWSSPN